MCINSGVCAICINLCCTARDKQRVCMCVCVFAFSLQVSCAHIQQLYQEIGKVFSVHGETLNWRDILTQTRCCCRARSVERATIVLICTVEQTHTHAREHTRPPSDSRVRKLSYYVSGVSARASVRMKVGLAAIEHATHIHINERSSLRRPRRRRYRVFSLLTPSRVMYTHECARPPRNVNNNSSEILLPNSRA